MLHEAAGFRAGRRRQEEEQQGAEKQNERETGKENIGSGNGGRLFDGGGTGLRGGQHRDIRDGNDAVCAGNHRVSGQHRRSVRHSGQ